MQQSKGIKTLKDDRERHKAYYKLGKEINSNKQQFIDKSTKHYLPERQSKEETQKQSQKHLQSKKDLLKTVKTEMLVKSQTQKDLKRQEAYIKRNGKGLGLLEINQEMKPKTRLYQDQ